MIILNPKEALDAAQAVYDLKNGIDYAKESFMRNEQLRQKFNFTDAQSFNSKTGAFLKVKSGFGMIAEGKGDGLAKDELLIAIRGTDLAALDLLSYALEKAVKISKEIAGWVEMLLKKILTMVGVVVKTINITVFFIRWVFQLLNNCLRTIVTASLNEAK